MTEAYWELKLDDGRVEALLATMSDEAAELSLSGEALFVSELQSDADYGGFMRISLV